jgi:propane monooxygenase reductase subunit
MKVRLEPVGEELDCASGETILEAAFRHGLNLVHGCREGQCSACRCFLLEGEVALRPHSSFALSEAEAEAGYSLLCRAEPETELTVELLQFDPDGLRLAHPIRDGVAAVEELRHLTGEITRLVLRLRDPRDFPFTPGQYIDLHVPGGGGRRSFSLANLPGEGRLELIVRRYPGGRISGMLGGEIRPGCELTFTGPYGSLRLHEGSTPVLLVAGGSGIAPILALLRQLAAEGARRPVRVFFGVRSEGELFLVDELRALGERLADFSLHLVTGRHLHEALEEAWQLTAPDVYACGPPPMIDAVEGVLQRRGVDPGRIFVDRFTTPPPAGGAGGGVTAPARDGREFTWYEPAGRRRTLYEDVTVDTQPSVHRHLTRGWPLHFADGRGTWDEESTAARCTDWFAFRDPAGEWERSFYSHAQARELAAESATRAAVREGLLEDLTPAWRSYLLSDGQVGAFVEHGLWFALATAGRDCLSDTLATAVCLQAAMKQRSAQAIVLAAMDLEPHLGEMSTDAARERFVTAAEWQRARALLERLAACTDWVEVVVAVNLCIEPVLGGLLHREIGLRAAAAGRDVVYPALARGATEEAAWARGWSTALVRMLRGDPAHGERNGKVITRWTAWWQAQALAAAEALVPLCREVVPDPEGLPRRLQSAGRRALAGAQDAGEAPRRRVRERAAPGSHAAPGGHGALGSHGAPGHARGRPSAQPAEGHEWVGIVMARSAEGDAVAEVLGRREEVEVLAQPAFWEIRARRRLTIPYAEITAALGYEIDGSSIQHEMSTHYGRMVAADDALMLFSDPAEAMEHLLA